MANVIFDAGNRELRNDASFFEPYDTRPDGIWWDVKEGDVVRPGMTLGHFVWPAESAKGVIVAPAGCAGRVTTINRKVEHDLLGDSPSQVLLVIAAA